MSATNLAETSFLIHAKKDMEARLRQIRHNRRVTKQTAAGLVDSRVRMDPSSEAYKLLSAEIEELKVAEAQMENLQESVIEQLEDVKHEMGDIKRRNKEDHQRAGQE